MSTIEVKSVQRRSFLQAACVSSVLAVASGAGLLRPEKVFAAQWPATAFSSTTLHDAVNNLFGSNQLNDDARVKIDAQTLAENGGRVPIAVETEFEEVEMIAVFVSENSYPLAARAQPRNAAAGFFGARIKMAKSSEILAVVKSSGKLYSARKYIEVTVGGCAG